MSFLKHLIVKNLRIWINHYFISTILLLFPVISLVAISFYYKYEEYTPQFNHKPLYFELDTISGGEVELKVMRYLLSDQTIGIIYSITGDSNVWNYNNKTFEDFITDEATGICLELNNCTWKEIKSRNDYEPEIWETIHLDLNNGNPQYKLYSSLLPIFPKINQISEWYNIPTSHGAYIYSYSFQVYFAKYLKSITQNKSVNPSIEKTKTITIYPMRTDPGIKEFDTDKADKIIREFVLSSASFFSVVVLFTQMWSQEKLKRIIDLLKYKGISKAQYITSWLIAYIIVNIIPMILFIICFSIFWIDWTWNSIALLFWMLLLNYLHIFVFSVLCVSFINKNNRTKWWIYVSYWSTILSYYEFWEIYQDSGILKYFFQWVPNNNFALSLRDIYLLSNYQTGATWPRLFYLHEDLSVFMILIENISVLVLWFLLIALIESDWISNKWFHRLRKMGPRSNEMAKVAQRNVNEDNSDSPCSKKQKLERFYESISDWNLIKQWENNECLRLQNIVKKFGEYVAVKDICLEWFKGQIFVLLGHNGAGKTTLLNLITGNLEVDRGDIILENNSCWENKDFLFSNIGLCGQEDIYFPDLTVYEQIELVSNLKGKSKENKTETLGLIASLGWKDYADSKASALSGGNWRKLSVAFAWLGNSKLVILDEPTSGMDANSKKLFWDFLKTVKQNRIIILTTHSMDEAECWGDNIGIMSEGELICRGTSSFWKQKYPCGYNINFVFMSNSITFKEKSDLVNILKKIEPEMTIKILSKDWIKLNFPESSLNNKKTNKIFTIIEQVKDKYKIKDYTVSTTSLEEVFFKVNDVDFARNWFETELEDIMKMISEQNKNESLLFLDEKAHSQNQEKRTNELNISQNEENSYDDIDWDISFPGRHSKDINDNINTNSNIRKSNSQHQDNLQNDVLKVQNPNDLKAVIESKHERWMLKNNNIRKHFLRSLRAFYRNLLGNIFRMIICLFLLLFSLILIHIVILTKYFRLFSVLDLFPKSTQTVYTIINKDQKNSTTKAIDELITVYDSMFSLKKWDLQVDSYNPINYTNISCNTDFDRNKNFLLVEYDAETINYTEYYDLSSPDISHSMLNSIITKHLSEAYNISTFLFEGYASSSVVISDKNEWTLGGYYLIVSCLVFSNWLFSLFCISLPFNDKKTEVKALIKLSNGNMYKYWIGLFLFDYMKYVILTIIMYIILYIEFESSLYLLPFSLLFGINFIMFAYCSTFFLESGTITKMIYLTINSIAMATYYQMRELITEMETIHEIILWDLLPFTSLMHYFFDIQMYYVIQIEGQSKELSDFIDVYLKQLLFAFCNFLIQFLIICLLLWGMENMVIREMIYFIHSRRAKSKGKGIKNKLLNNKGNHEQEKWNSEDSWYNKDQDNVNVLQAPLLPNNDFINPTKENTEILKQQISDDTNNFVLQLNNVSVEYKKLFSKNILAIDEIYLGLERNERFALMGLNNSGKSTIIKTIINLLNYDQGFIKFSNHILPEDFNEIRKDIGYCPEKNSLFPYLTVYETFDYYYNCDFVNIWTQNMTEINESNDTSATSGDCTRKRNIHMWIQGNGLSNYTNVLTMNLSGGNKRKLLFAIALMNNPQLTLLDEPSTGVDPDSRRLMWKNLSTIQRKNRTLGYNFNWILSTQSIEEAEILCDNLGWLKKGTFVYMGNTENWKMELSDGYYMTIRFKKPWMNDINDWYANPLKNLDNVEGISALNIDTIIKDKDIEMLYYLSNWDDICGTWLEAKTKMKFIDYIENSFRMILTIQSNKGYIFSNLLNLKSIFKCISELTLSMQKYESFIENLYEK